MITRDFEYSSYAYDNDRPANEVEGFADFSLLSRVLKYSFGLPCQLEQKIGNAKLWENVDAKIVAEEAALNVCLEYAFSELPNEYSQLDLWPSVQNGIQISDNSTQTGWSIKGFHSLGISSTESIDLNSVLAKGYQLPDSLPDIDLWDRIEAQIDESYHQAIFTESATPEMSVKEKYFIGLSEFVDEECSSSKSALIHDHLLQCAGCRERFLSICKTGKALKFALSDSVASSGLDLWPRIDAELFPVVFSEEDYSEEQDTRSA